MNCTQLDQYLDAMLDGTLTADELQSVEAHCQGCAACAEKLKANRQMMRVFAEMAPEMDVPLTAQARWREAVRSEARVPARRSFRLIGGIAAALVVALGATFALKTPAVSSQLHNKNVFLGLSCGRELSDELQNEVRKNMVGAYLSLRKHMRLFFNGGIDEEMEDFEDEIHEMFTDYVKKF